MEYLIQTQKEEEPGQGSCVGLLLETICNILTSLTERLLVFSSCICQLKMVVRNSCRKGQGMDQGYMME